MGWISSYIFPTLATHWFYNPTPSVAGIQRNPAVQPSLNGQVTYQVPTAYTFKSNRTYQYEVEVKGNFTGIGMSASYQWQNSSIFQPGGNNFRTDRIVGVDAGTGARYYFYSSPQSNTPAISTFFLWATGALSGNLSTSPRITNIKISEIDWMISGYKRYNPGTNSTISDVNYNGWSYDKPIDTFWWTNRPSPIMGATGLAINGDMSSNYIAKTVPYNYYNLSFQYQTFTGSFGANPDNIKIQTSTSLAGPRTTLYTLTQSTATNSFAIHQVFGLQGNGNYIFFVGSTTSNTNGFIASITNVRVIGGYHPDNNQQFLFTNSGSYSNPTPLQILGTATLGMTFSFIVGSGSTIGITPSNLNVINAQFGNGTFRAGVWENGVWNSGWRVDTEIHEFDNVGVAFRTIADRRWRIQLTGPTASAAQFQIGERISISNIVAIDINETRKLLKGYFTIINKSDTSLIVETDVSFPFRRIEKDSINHKIKITKNVWLSGAFLNGYYTGIWNYGLFKGFPRITEMVDTHWIDGTFDGGHFNSIYEAFKFEQTEYISSIGYGLDSSFEGKLGLSFSTPHGFVIGDIINIKKDNTLVNASYDGNTTVLSVINDYLIVTNKSYGTFSGTESGTSSNVRATGLIQNFKFTDNNIASKVSAQNPGSSEEVFQFNSWIDVNYYNTSAVNIGKPVRLFDTSTRLEYTQNNLYGYPTNDVLSSESTFRDSYSLNKRNYKLGTKYKIFQDQIGKGSEFEKPFDMVTGSNAIGLDAFINYGWTFSGTHSTYERSTENTTYNSTVTEEYAIKGEELVITSTMSGALLNNDNIILENDRYTIVELDVKSYSVGTNSTYYQSNFITDGSNTIYPISTFYPIPILNFSNINQFKQSFSFFNIIFTYYTPMTYLPIWENVNHLLTSSIRKTEYFYNKPTLSMKTLGADDLGINFTDGASPIGSDVGSLDGLYQSTIIMDNLKYYEVDMIPFFQYFTDVNIYKGVSVPWQGIAPFIDYTDSNFSFIDNVNIGFGSVQTQQSFTPISGVGIGINTNTNPNIIYDDVVFVFGPG